MRAPQLFDLIYTQYGLLGSLPVTSISSEQQTMLMARPSSMLYIHHMSGIDHPSFLPLGYKSRTGVFGGTLLFWISVTVGDVGDADVTSPGTLKAAVWTLQPRSAKS